MNIDKVNEAAGKRRQTKVIWARLALDAYAILKKQAATVGATFAEYCRAILEQAAKEITSKNK